MQLPQLQPKSKIITDPKTPYEKWVYYYRNDPNAVYAAVMPTQKQLDDAVARWDREQQQMKRILPKNTKITDQELPIKERWLISQPTPQQPVAPTPDVKETPNTNNTTKWVPWNVTTPSKQTLVTQRIMTNMSKLSEAINWLTDIQKNDLDIRLQELLDSFSISTNDLYV